MSVKYVPMPGTEQAFHKMATNILPTTIIRIRFLEAVAVLEGQEKSHGWKGQEPFQANRVAETTCTGD